MTQSVDPISKPEEKRNHGIVPPAIRSAGVLIQGLERLRESLLPRLQKIEELAVEQAYLLEQDASEREQQLRQRVATLEAAQARLQAEAIRREQELNAILQELASDRQLLASAWERLEQETIAAPRGPGPSHAPQIMEVKPESTSSPIRPGAARGEDRPHNHETVTQEILKQFQSLKLDVRRTARGKKGP
ncbi:MAG: hypothetical protein NVSMB9_35400 [Isosphaeraceae bacterium]